VPLPGRTRSALWQHSDDASTDSIGFGGSGYTLKSSSCVAGHQPRCDLFLGDLLLRTDSNCFAEAGARIA
jgi:hypothetical protein